MKKIFLFAFITLCFLHKTAYSAGIPHEVIEAVKARNYQQAITDLQAEIKTQRQSDLLHRTLGILYEKVGKQIQARSSFKQAAKLDKKNPANHYYLGIASLKQGYLKEARRSFERVIDINPKSDFAIKIQSDPLFLENLRQAVERSRSKQFEKLNLRASLIYEFNTNAAAKQLRLDWEDSEDHIFETRVSTDYAWLDRGSSYQFKTGFDYNSSWHASNSKLDYTSYNPDIVFTKRFDANAFKLKSIELKHDYTVSSLRRDFYAWGTGLKESLRFEPLERYYLTLYHRYRYQNYNDDGSDPASFSKDGHTNEFGAQNFVYFKNGQYAYLNYSFGKAQTRGNNFDKWTHNFFYGWHLPLGKKNGLLLNGGMRFTDYHKDSRQTRRKDDQYSFGAQLSRQLSKSWELAFTYRYLYNDSKVKANEYRRQSASCELTFRY